MSKTARLTLLALLVTGGLAFGATAWGRAGGGNHYSGSSRSSSSSSSSSSSRRSSSSGWHSSGSTRSSGGGGGSSTPLGCCCITVMLLGVGLAFLLSKSLRSLVAAKNTTEAIRQQQGERRVGQPPAEIAEGLQRITARDPGFTAAEALGTARRLFVELQAAWSRGDLADVQRGLSDGVLRRFTVQLALNAYFKRRNVTADVRIREASLVGVESDDEFDTLHVRFDAAARDCDVPPELPEAQAMARAAQAPAAPFVEYWSFVRRLNPQHVGKLSEGKCPACGAPVPTQATVSCEYCKAILNSGAYDWVLAEITQDGEFELRPGRQVEGFARLKAGDPAVNRQILEDRASLVFWKWVEAQATGEPQRFARLCTPAALNDLTAARAQPTEALARAAVGAVDLCQLGTDADFDRASFEVRWSTAGAGAGVVRTSVLTLARRGGVKTSSKTGMSTDRCHACAAPQTDGAAVNCGHCGNLLSQDWSFEEVVSLDAFRARRRGAEQSQDELQARLGDLSDPWERLRALSVMVAMARADGVVTESEQRLLRDCARRWGIDNVRLQGLLAAPLSELSAVVPRGLDEARSLYRALVAAALVDGVIDPAERKLLEAMAAHLKLPPEEAQAILRELRDAVAKLRQQG